MTEIITWNVNGLRAVLRKNALNWLIGEKPDIICFQETRVIPEQISDHLNELLPEYRQTWNPAEKAGYSGVLTLSKEQPVSENLSSNSAKFDREGRLIQLSYPEFDLFNIYFPNGQRGKDRLDYKLDFYRNLLDMIRPMIESGRKLIITGDFNTAHQEIDLKNPKENKDVSGFMPVEREWISNFLNEGLIDIYRVMYPDKEEYTWWTYRFNARARNIGWRIDYFLITENLVDLLIDINIRGEISGSDHCPVQISFNF